MGNRAVITTRYNFENNGVGIYLHWCGDRDSVEAFLKYAKLRGFRSPDKDCYGWARLCQVIGNYFGGGLSIGIDTVDKLDTDNWDNGVYIIEGWDIIGREYFDWEKQDSYDMQEILVRIDEMQPCQDQLGEGFLLAKEVATSQIENGDRVYVYDNITESYELHKVCGFGNGYVNGTDVTGIPYVEMYGEDYSKNINNYLRENIYRVAQTEPE